MDPHQKKVVDYLSIEDIAQHIPIIKLLEAFVFKVASKSGFGWVYTVYRLLKKTVYSIIYSCKLLFAFKYNQFYSSEFTPYQVKIIHSIQTNRPKIVHAIANFATGGSSQLVVDLIENLGHQYEQEVIVRQNPVPPSFVGQKLYNYKTLSHYKELLPYLQKYSPDLIHVHYWNWGDKLWYRHIFEASQKYGCKIIENINVPVEPYINPAIDRYVYVSDYVREQFGNSVDTNLTIYPGSNFRHFRRHHDTSITDNCIGMVYRLDHHKVDEHSIDVFIKVAQRKKGVRVLIVGGGTYLDLYQQIVEKAGVCDAFEFTGYVAYNQLPDLYRQLSIFVAPVVQESFGQVSPFAMSMEIPVVGYNVGALKEILGSDALLVPVGESDALANLIIELLNDREQRLAIGTANRQRALNLFSVETMIKKYAQLYEEVLNSRSSQIDLKTSN